MFTRRKHDHSARRGCQSSPPGRRPLRASRATLALPWLVPAIALLVAGGCSLRDDPSYNRYAPTDGDPTLLQRADMLVSSAEDALDNARQRIENIID